MKTLTSQVRWKPPPVDAWKLNSDAPWSESQKRGGIGWIFRDSSGSSICMEFQQIKEKWSIKILEMKEILEGLKNIPSTSHGDSSQASIPIFVESDAVNVIKILNGEDEDLSEISFLTEEIICLKNRFVEIKFDYCPRDQNLAVDLLARIAISPPSLVPVLESSPMVEEGVGCVVWAPFCD